MKNFYKATVSEVELLFEEPKGTHSGLSCPDCGKELIVREGYSKFLGCSGYPKCTGKFGITTATPMAEMRNNLHHITFVSESTYDKDFPLDDTSWEAMMEHYPSINCKDDM